MKKIKFFLFYILCLLYLNNCSNQPPKIYHLQNTYLAKYYVIDHFKDNEQCIKYVFSFSKKNNGYLQILTNKNIFEFEDGIEFIKDTTKQRFSFSRKDNGFQNEYIIVNFLKNIPIQFQNEQGKEVKPYEPPVIKVSATDYEEEASKINSKTLSLYYNFETLNLNILQNLLDFAEQDKEKKEIDTYIYELYNKDKEKKVVITYHDKGEWFEVEII